MRRFLTRLGAFGAVTLFVLELLFRTAIPAAETPHFTLDEQRGFVVNDTAGPRSGLFTAGRLAQVRTHWRVNDRGWLSPIGYRRPGQRTRPCIALIGDSYVEGIHVDPMDNVPAFLDRALGGAFAVYAFGTPGAGLSHYAWITNHVVDRYRPDCLVYFIVEGDLEESVAGLWPNPLSAQYVESAGRFAVREPSYEPRPHRRLLRRSALARYLLINVRLVLPGDGARTVYAGREEQLIEDAARRAVDGIRASAGDTPVLFVLDAQRDSIYRAPEGGFRESFTNRTAKLVFTEAGVPVLDLTPVFLRDFQRHRELLNYDVNYHWNPRARRLIADAVAARLRDMGVAEP